MSKELEYIEKMICWYDDNFSQLGKERNQEHIKQLTKIKSILAEYEAIDNANPSEALAYIDAFIEENNNDIKNQDITGFDIDTQAKWVKYLEHKSSMLSIIKQALLKAQENARSDEILQKFYQDGITLDSVRALKLRMEALEKDLEEQRELAKYYLEEQEKENELLKEIIKSLFDRGCPLHQYIDKDFGLTIEVDNECSIMHLGKFKDIDLDKKLQEVLEDE